MEEYNDDEITKPWKDRIVKYFVYIIESPSLGDMEEGLTEGKALANALKFLKIRCSYNFVPDKRNFFNTFQNLLDCDLMKNNSKPIIHIIAHGCEGAIGLIDDSFIFWDELKNALIPISKALNNNYLLCISACKGFYFIKEAYYDENGNMPFNAFA
ncbi:MAG: hypothetical protein M1365_06405, partial [Actinobacteria bacterium]|nr:hypothetical protein [Actinomycetota bacterium]